jgi:hypothetical protein
MSFSRVGARRISLPPALRRDAATATKEILKMRLQGEHPSGCPIADSAEIATSTIIYWLRKTNGMAEILVLHVRRLLS